MRQRQLQMPPLRASKLGSGPCYSCGAPVRMTGHCFYGFGGTEVPPYPDLVVAADGFGRDVFGVDEGAGNGLADEAVQVGAGDVEVAGGHRLVAVALAEGGFGETDLVVAQLALE